MQIRFQARNTFDLVKAIIDMPDAFRKVDVDKCLTHCDDQISALKTLTQKTPEDILLTGRFHILKCHYYEKFSTHTPEALRHALEDAISSLDPIRFCSSETRRTLSTLHRHAAIEYLKAYDLINAKVHFEQCIVILEDNNSSKFTTELRDEYFAFGCALNHYGYNEESSFYFIKCHDILTQTTIEDRILDEWLLFAGISYFFLGQCKQQGDWRKFIVILNKLVDVINAIISLDGEEGKKHQDKLLDLVCTCVAIEGSYAFDSYATSITPKTDFEFSLLFYIHLGLAKKYAKGYQHSKAREYFKKAIHCSLAFPTNKKASANYLASAFDGLRDLSLINTTDYILYTFALMFLTGEAQLTAPFPMVMWAVVPTPGNFYILFNAITQYSNVHQPVSLLKDLLLVMKMIQKFKDGKETKSLMTEHFENENNDARFARELEEVEAQVNSLETILISNTPSFSAGVALAIEKLQNIVREQQAIIADLQKQVAVSHAKAPKRQGNTLYHYFQPAAKRAKIDSANRETLTTAPNFNANALTPSNHS